MNRAVSWGLPIFFSLLITCCLPANRALGFQVTLEGGEIVFEGNSTILDASGNEYSDSTGSIITIPPGSSAIFDGGTTSTGGVGAYVDIYVSDYADDFYPYFDVQATAGSYASVGDGEAGSSFITAYTSSSILFRLTSDSGPVWFRQLEKTGSITITPEIGPTGLLTPGDYRIDFNVSSSASVGGCPPCSDDGPIDTASLRLEFLDSEPLIGDFNFDGSLDCEDVDALTSTSVAGVNSPLYDLNLDGVVDANDVTEWLRVAGAQPGSPTAGAPFLPADANLDGLVDISDFNLWNQNKFTSVAAWCRGDFNVDGVVDTSDFNLWNDVKFTASGGSVVVPEPAISVVLLGLLATVRRKRHIATIAARFPFAP